MLRKLTPVLCCLTLGLGLAASPTDWLMMKPFLQPPGLGPGPARRSQAPAQRAWLVYKVRKGDTLALLAARYGVTPAAIRGRNGHEARRLALGQELRIAINADHPGSGRLPPGIETYTIRSGDTLGGLGRRFGATLQELVSANPGLQSLDGLGVGSILYVPTGVKGLLVELGQGQTLLDLSQRFGLPVSQLARANQYQSPLQPRHGDLIVLPGLQARRGYERLLAVREERLARAAQPLARRKPEATWPVAQNRTRVSRARASRPVLRRASYAPKGFQWPLLGSGEPLITTYYGGRTPFERFHAGLDVAAPLGTPIYAARAGEVEVAGWSNYGFGLYIVLDSGGDVATQYGHLSRLAVQAWDRVAQGELIGYVGSTGNSTGPHLDFRIRLGGQSVDPLEYLP